jgi:hypothetical protein
MWLSPGLPGTNVGTLEHRNGPMCISGVLLLLGGGDFLDQGPPTSTTSAVAVPRSQPQERKPLPGYPHGH